MKRKSKSPQRKLMDSLWKECRRICDTLYRNDKCFTCDNPISGSNKQLGHFIPKSIGGALLHFHLQNLRWQCYRCNINLSGNGAIFYKRLVEQEGQGYVDNLFELKGKTTKSTDHYLQLLEEYAKM